MCIAKLHFIRQNVLTHLCTMLVCQKIYVKFKLLAKDRPTLNVR